MPAVSNTSPIFNLARIQRLDLLREQFGTVWIPEAVNAELRSVPDRDTGRAIEDAREAGWLENRPASNATLITLLTAELHRGEAEAIALALELNVERVLIDERDGRILARDLGLPVTGVLGILLRAKNKPEIDALRAKAGFFITASLEAGILAEAGET